MEKHDNTQPDGVKPNGVKPNDVKPAAENIVAYTPKPASEEEAPLSFKEWWIQNGPVLTIVFALIAFLFFKFDSEGLWAIAKAALGLSFVIFIHEMGHFLVAKWCDVHVTAFSIGFGPVIPGCWFKWGETTYKLALFPLGGYVQMVGQVDGDEASDGSEEDPRSFRNKSVGARMAIISAGVAMNVVLAVVCFVVVFRGPGKDRQAAVIAAVDTGSPAFKEGIRTGAEVLRIDDHDHPYFENLKMTVMASFEHQKLDFVVKRAQDSEARHVQIGTKKDTDDEYPAIGLVPSQRLVLVPPRFKRLGFDEPVYPGSAAASAVPGFEFGDIFVATTDPENPKQIKQLPDDPRFPGQGQRDYFEFARRMQMLVGKEVVIVVERGVGEAKTTREIRVPPASQRTLGVQMQMGYITSLREQSSGHKAGLRVSTPKRHGDLIQKVEVKTASGSTQIWNSPSLDLKTVGEGSTLDPEKLPFELSRWAAELRTAKVAQPWKVTLHVQRKQDPKEGSEEIVTVPVEVVWDDDWRFDQAIPLGMPSPLAIPELGIAYQVKNMIAAVRPGPLDAKSNPLRAGDVITAIRMTADGPKEEPGAWLELQKVDSTGKKIDLDYWAVISRNKLGGPVGLKKMDLKVSRNIDGKTETHEFSIVPVPDPDWPIAERGFTFDQDIRRQWADSTWEAIVLGLRDTHNSMIQVFQNIRGMVLGRLSVKNLGGPVTIARVAYRFAGIDFWEFVFFLGLISVNLAVINFLPIPVLDGGHMVFLLYEKIRGRPASEAIRIGATYAGLAIILCLMVFVLYLDISRLFL